MRMKFFMEFFLLLVVARSIILIIVKMFTKVNSKYFYCI